MQAFIGLVPLISTNAGSYLTSQNWLEANVSHLSCQLQSLLIKPGFKLLMRLPSLGRFLGWNQGLFLDASLPELDKNGLYVLISPYDGGKIKHTPDEIEELLMQLQSDPLVQLTTAQQDLVVSDLSLERMLQMKRKIRGCGFINDRPAEDACQGLVYTQQGIVDLKQLEQSLNFDTLSQDCLCPVCEQHLTRAYFHHLYFNTPYLCKRFLIQHNVWFTQAQLASCS